MYESQLDVPLVHAGKVRELYALDDDRLLMVATDRISAFDFVLDSQIPDKGRVLTSLSSWWFAQLGDLVPNHVLSTDVPAPVRGRAVVCERLEMVPVECVARGYLTGSGWLEYQESGTVCGLPLPPVVWVPSPWAQGVAGSNPVAPTTIQRGTLSEQSEPKGRPEHFPSLG